MKRNLLLSVVMLMFGISLFAQSGICGDNLTWELSNGTLTISGTGKMNDYYYFNSSPWYSYRESIKKVIINDGVTSIGNYAFEDCSSLTSIEIPNSVTSIGGQAFSNCSSLTSIEIPDGITSIEGGAFEYCSSLTSVTIPNSVTSIGGQTFQNCSSLTSVTIPNSVTSIGNDAFYNCSGLTSIEIPNSVTSIGGEAFSGCSSLTSVTIPNSVTSIGSSAFSGCSSLASIEIPNSVTSIGSVTFSGCSSLASIEIPNSVTSIGESAFSRCSGLTSIEIPNSVTSIGDYAFRDCSSLASVTIPNSVTSFGRCVTFSGCSSLTEVTIDLNRLLNESQFNVSSLFGKQVKKYIIGNSVTSIGKSAFRDCSSLTSIEIPNSVTSIGGSAFNGCSSLTSVTIPNSVTSIGEYAFYRCSSLTSVTIGNGVTSIGDYAFYGCSEVESLTLGKALKSIGFLAFSGCKRITDIYCYAERVPDVYNEILDSFKEVSRKAILWVPANRLLNYTTDEYWGQFDVRPMQSDDANTDKVVIKTGDNDAQIIWPKVDGVDSYELTISDMAGNTICTLTFNADGQLQSINFKMPAIDPQSAPEQAQSTGFSFTVNGLETNTTYKYLIEAKDVSEKVIESYQGQFTTDGNVYDALENVNGVGEQPIRKVFENGRVVIIAPDGKRYGVSGAEIR